MFCQLSALKISILIICTLTMKTVFSQVVFNETFNEANNATSGTDNIGGVAWTSSCPTCLSGDYWYVKNGVFECNDSNGEAVWSTNNINISSCSSVEVSFTITEVGTLEACGTGCNSVDWVSFQYNIDGSGWQNPGNSFFCSGACAGKNVIVADDLSGGTTNYASGCITGGTNMQIRIIAQNWAQAEYWRIDNVTVSCACDVLPIEMSYFNAEPTADNSIALTWQTITETNNDSFTIERSMNAVDWENISTIEGAGNSLQPIDYREYDHSPYSGTSYYRIKQKDFDGKQSLTPAQAVSFEKIYATLKAFPNPFEDNVSLELPSTLMFPVNITVEDYLGRIIYNNLHTTTTQMVNIPLDTELESGTYLVRVSDENAHFVERLIKLPKP